MAAILVIFEENRLLSFCGLDKADLEFLEVQNQKELNVFPYNFTSCFSTMYNYTNILQVTSINQSINQGHLFLAHFNNKAPQSASKHI